MFSGNQSATIGFTAINACPAHVYLGPVSRCLKERIRAFPFFSFMFPYSVGTQFVSALYSDVMGQQQQPMEPYSQQQANIEILRKRTAMVKEIQSNFKRPMLASRFRKSFWP
jgi:hypothetical protein